MCSLVPTYERTHPIFFALVVVVGLHFLRICKQVDLEWRRVRVKVLFFFFCGESLREGIESYLLFWFGQIDPPTLTSDQL